MNWDTFTSAFLGAGFASSFIGVLLSLWVNHRLEIERKTLFEKRQFEQKRREASKAIVDILAEWIRPKYEGGTSNKDRWQLQKTYWENILLLDKDLFDLLSSRLANDPDAVDTNELIVQVRRVLLELDRPDISSDQLNTWKPLL